MPELPILDAKGKLRKDVCKIAALNFRSLLSEAEAIALKRYTIPGLDAALCRCQDCQGVFWFSPMVRDRIIKRKYAYEGLNRGAAVGELERDGSE